MGVSFAVIGWERLVGCGLRGRCCGVGSRGVGVLVEGTTGAVVILIRRVFEGSVLRIVVTPAAGQYRPNMRPY